MATTDQLNQYAELKKQEKELAAKLEELKPIVFKYLVDQGLNEETPMELPGQGTFTLGSRRKWVYSKTVEEAEGKLKEMKTDEERTGMAEYTKSDYLIFRELE